ncbi:DUF1513 domain-containing protein [Halomonas sp. V046]|uniref:DUF1513 domain-containing protein n=1 Tax=Halomonas sp. V046 TaxID=3459611 RepID=UPI004043A05D
MATDHLRRRLLALGLGSAAACSLPTAIHAMANAAAAPSDRASPDTTAWLFSAADGEDGSHHLAAIRRDGEGHFLLPAPERCHGGCLRPGKAQAVLFARRPGRQFHVLSPDTERCLVSVDAGAGYHFYGHGVFDPSGRWLYVTAQRLSDAMGLVRVYDADATAGYRLVHDIALDGIGPHEIRLMPDGDTLAVALGGIRTHPDSGRVKLNLDTMDPALLLVDRHSGKILSRHRPSHHQLSCRHLDVADDGSIVAGYQFQGPEWETQHPLIARLSPDGDFEEISLPAPHQARLAQYTASVALSRNGRLALITAPRGGRVLLLEPGTGKIIASPRLDDAAGARRDDRDDRADGPETDIGFYLTSGDGGFHHLSAQGELTTLARLPLRWDNHLT